MAGMLASYDRRYFFLHSDLLLYANRSRPDDEPTVATNLRLCTVKPVDTSGGERRFMFQVVSPVKSYVLQAGSEEEQRGWIRGLQDAIQRSLQGGGGSEEEYGMTRGKKVREGKRRVEEREEGKGRVGIVYECMVYVWYDVWYV